MIPVAVYCQPSVSMAPFAAEIHYKAVFLAFASVCAAEDVVPLQWVPCAISAAEKTPSIVSHLYHLPAAGLRPSGILAHPTPAVS